MVWSITSKDEESAILEILETRSPRIVAIVGSAILERRLEQSLRSRLRRGDTVNKLFKPTGALGSFAVKIDLGYVLHMYGKDEHAALTGISEIRNLFAHLLICHLARSAYTHLLGNSNCTRSVVTTQRRCGMVTQRLRSNRRRIILRCSW